MVGVGGGGRGWKEVGRCGVCRCARTGVPETHWHSHVPHGDSERIGPEWEELRVFAQLGHVQMVMLADSQSARFDFQPCTRPERGR